MDEPRKSWRDMRDDDLTPRRKRFCAEYLVDLNATAAARRAGYSVNSAEAEGGRLLKNDRVRQRIDEMKLEREERTEVTADMVVKELALLAFSNMDDYISCDDGGMAYTDLSALNRKQAAAIQEITVDSYTEGKGDDAVPVKRVKLKLADKKSALELLGRHLALFKDRTEHSLDRATINVLTGVPPVDGD